MNRAEIERRREERIAELRHLLTQRIGGRARERVTIELGGFLGGSSGCCCGTHEGGAA